MDKSWMKKARTSREYILGCKEFVEFAWSHRPPDFRETIYCPCQRCINFKILPKKDVLRHILEYGILRSYVCWTNHGEVEEESMSGNENEENDEMREMLQDAFGFQNLVDKNVEDFNEPTPNEPHRSDPENEELNEEAEKFFKLLRKAETPLYPGCTKHSKLSFLVRLLHLKGLSGWSNKSFDMLLQVLNDSLPEDINLPKNYYESKKQLRDLGLECIKIEACPNDCMLYWKEKSNNDTCDICMGPGVTPTSYYGSTRYSLLGNMGKNMQDEIDRMVEERVEERTRKMYEEIDRMVETRLKAEKEEMRAIMMQHLCSTNAVGAFKVKDIENTNLTKDVHSQTHHKGTPLRKCKLTNWQKKVVAEGRLESMDPSVLVHHIPLGVDNYKVWIDNVLDPKAALWRATSEMSTIEDAMGTTVAWNKDYIYFD